MSELNQLLLDFDYKTNFNEHDFYLSKSNSNAFNLINRWPDWNKKILNTVSYTHLTLPTINWV